MAQLRAVDYLRVSTEDQVKGYGISAASRKTLAYIERKGWEHVGTFVDEGLSGSLEAHDRPDLKRLMALARRPTRPFDMVVVSEGRAIGRTGRAFWRWVWELEDLGVYVAVVRGDYDNSTPAGRSRMRADADKAEEEREIIRDRTQGGIQEKAEDGLHPGGQAKYGYRIADQGKKGLSRLVLDECDGGERCTRSDPCETQHEAATLRRARDLVVKHRGNWSATALHLNAEGYLTRSSKRWTAPNLRSRVLDDGLLAGQYVFRKAKNAILDSDGRPIWGESITITLDRVFTEDEVVELRKACAPRARLKSGAGRAYTLTGRIESLCGKRYRGSSPKDRAVSAHYGCAGKTPAFAGGPTCDCAQIDAAGVEEWVWGEVKAMLQDPKELELLAARQAARRVAGTVDYATRLAELDQQVAEQNDAIDTMMVMAAKRAASKGLRGAAAQDAAARMLQPLEDELSALEAQRQEVISWQGEAAQAADEIKGLRALAEMAREGLDDIEPERQAELFDLLQIKGRLLAPPPPMRKGPPCGLAAWFRERDRLVPELTDEGWELVAPLIAGRTTDARKVLEALLRKVLTGARWRELETEYGTTALRSCWKRWSASGLWEEVMAALPQEGQPVPRQHPLPLIALTGKLQPGLIFLASEDHDREPAPWGQFFNVAYQFSMATAV